MAVLLLSGRKINWAKPPKATAKVMWSQKTTGGKKVVGSLRTIAHLDYLNNLARKRFGRGLVVIQGPYNTTVKASAGTHDYDACLDVSIPGVPWLTQQNFFRANGGGAYYRGPENGFKTKHIHYFTLPYHAKGVEVSQGYQRTGFKVGRYVDGGWSTAGKRTTSSQIEDYYNRRNALKGHARDGTWFPPDIDKTIFNLTKYIARHKALQQRTAA